MLPPRQNPLGETFLGVLGGTTTKCSPQGREAKCLGSACGCWAARCCWWGCVLSSVWCWGTVSLPGSFLGVFLRGASSVPWSDQTQTSLRYASCVSLSGNLVSRRCTAGAYQALHLVSNCFQVTSHLNVRASLLYFWNWSKERRKVLSEWVYNDCDCFSYKSITHFVCAAIELMWDCSYLSAISGFFPSSLVSAGSLT